MPWKVTGKAKGCNGFAVVKEGSNTPIPGGCHPTRKEAIAHLIAVRLSYDERGVDQPRDKDGKFASKGGGGAASAASTDGEPGSKMKQAPKNVTSKGVNPNSEYVLSEKTGNVFKNPQYNGNPNGKGKYSPAGRNRDQQADFESLGGGSKFLATGQAKHKANTAAPQTKTKGKVGKTLPGQVKGERKDCGDPALQKRMLAAQENARGSGDPVLDAIAKEQGFTGLPLKIESDQQAQEMIANGYKQNFRGTSSSSSDPRKFGDQYVEGDYYAGLGVYGNGTYTSNSPLTAQAYAGGKNGFGSVNEILISPDARIVTAKEIRAFRDGERVKLERQLKVARDAGDMQRMREIRAMDNVLNDAGRTAALMGVDGFVQAGTGAFKQGGKIIREDYTVLLNRTASASRVIRTIGKKST